MDKLQRNLLIVFGVVLLFLIVLVAGAAVNARSQIENNQLSRESYQRLLVVENLVTTLFEAESSKRAYLISGQDVYLEENERQTAKLLNLLEQVRQSEVPSYGDLPAKVTTLRQLTRQRLSMIKEMITLRREKGFVIAAETTRLYEGKRVMDKIRAAKNEVFEGERSLLERRRQVAEYSARNFIFLAVGATLFNFVLLAIAFVITSRSLQHGQRLMNKLRSASTDIAEINELSSSLQSCDTTEEAAKVIRHFMQRLFPGAAGGFYIMKASRNLLYLATAWNDSDHDFPDPIQPNDCWALRLGRTYQAQNDGQKMKCTHIVEGEVAYLCIPLMAQSEIVGMLHLEVSDSRELNIIRDRAELTANHTSAALSGIALREALRQKSVRDPLTNLYNRRYLEDNMERELYRALRNKSPFTVIMIDLDHFKSFNDTNGHQAGDQLLKEFSNFLRERVRGGDIPCRYGGEEFLLLLPGASLSEGVAKAEQLRQGISTLDIRFNDRELPGITASFGVATFPEHGNTWELVVQAADSALYEAKRAGRDEVCAADGQIPDTLEAIT